MLARDVQIANIDGVHWANWFHLLMPPRLRTGAPWVVLILQHGVLVKAVVRGRGAVDPADVPFSGVGPAQLRRVAQALDAGVAIAVERAVISELHAGIERELDMDADFAAQALVIVRALKQRSGKGIWVEPDLFELIPPVSYQALQRTFDLLVPDNTSMAAYVFEDDGSDVHASIIAIKRHGHIALVTTHHALSDRMDARSLARDWRHRHRQLSTLMAERYEKPVIGLFLQRSAFHRITAGPSDQLTRELGARHVIVDPAPAWLLGLLGGAAMAAVAGRGARALARMLPRPARQMASNLAHTAQSALRDHAHPFALLGFDPIELFLRLRHFYRDSQEETSPAPSAS